MGQDGHLGTTSLKREEGRARSSGIGSRWSAMTRSLPHRGPQGWRKWCCAATKRFCMRSSATVPLSRCSGPTLLSWRQCDSFIFHMCTARYSQASTTGSMMMIAVRGRSGTGRAGPATGLDQPSSAGVTAALPGCGRDMDVMYPARCDCAQPAWEYLHGVKMELQSCRTAPCWRHSVGCRQCRRRLSRVLAARERGEKVLPNSRDTANERFVTLASHLGMEQA